MVAREVLNCWSAVILDLQSMLSKSPVIPDEADLERMRAPAPEDATPWSGGRSQAARLALLVDMLAPLRHASADPATLRRIAGWLEAFGRHVDPWSDRLEGDADLLRAVAAEGERDPWEAVRLARVAAFGYRSTGNPGEAALADVAASAAEALTFAATAEQVRETLAALPHSPMYDALRDAVEERLTAIGEARALGSDPHGLEETNRPPGIRRELAHVARRLAPYYVAAEDLDAAVSWARTADVLAAAVGERPDARESLSDLLLSQRRRREAVPVLEELLAEQPDLPKLRMKLADAYAGAGRLDDGLALLLRNVGDPPTAADGPDLQSAALLLAREGDPRRSKYEEILSQVAPDLQLTALAPQPAAPTPLLARYVDGTVEVAQDLLELPEMERQAHIVAAIVAGTSDGISLLEQTFQDDPDLARRAATLLGLRIRTPEEQAAEEAFERAEAHFAKQEFAEAVEDYQEALRHHPDHEAALLFLGDAHYNLGAYHLARAYFEESIAVRESPQAWRFLGDAIRIGGGGVAAARRCYEYALTLDPAYGGAAMALAALPPEGAAEDEPKPLGASDGSIAWPGSNETVTERVLRPPQPSDAETPYPDARIDLEKVLTGDDRRFAGWLESDASHSWLAALGLLRMLVFQASAKSGDLERAERLARRSVAIAERIPEQWPERDLGELGRERHRADSAWQLADVLGDRGQFDEQHDWLLAAARHMVADQDERNGTGRALETTYDRLFHTEDPRASLHRALATSYARRGDSEGAAREAKLAAERGAKRPSTEVLVSGLVYAAMGAFEAGDIDIALGDLHRALPEAEVEASRAVVPRALANVVHHLGVVHGRMGLGRSALRHLDRARDLNQLTNNAERLSADWRAIGDVRADRPDLGSPAEAYEQALRLASELGAASELTWSDKGRYNLAGRSRRACLAGDPAAGGRARGGEQPRRRNSHPSAWHGPGRTRPVYCD